jgi:hypothetical protein
MPRVIKWNGMMALEWRRIALWFRPKNWMCKIELLRPKRAQRVGVPGSPQLGTTALLIYAGPLLVIMESRRPSFSASLIPWGASW